VVGAVGLNANILAHITLTPPQTTPPPAPTALSLNPASVTGGTSSQGTITIASAAPAGGASYSLASANAAVASVPAAVVVPAGATTGTFTVTTTSVTGQQVVTITATGGGASQSATLAVNPAGGPPPPPPPNTDTVRVTRAQYDTQKRELRVEATSTSATATLRALNDATSAVIGTLQNNGGGQYRGQFTNVANPGTVRVTSSLGGSATLAVSGATGTVRPLAGTTVAAPSASAKPAPAARPAAPLLHATSEVALPQADPQDHAAPRIAFLRALPRRVRVGSRRGTLVSFTLSEAARVTLSFQRLHRGRFGAVPGAVERTLPKGRVRVRFNGLLPKGAALRPGVYRVTVNAVDASGNRAEVRRLVIFLRPAIS
jgi:hypothetical protein